MDLRERAPAQLGGEGRDLLGSGGGVRWSPNRIASDLTTLFHQIQGSLS
jgi:hypothetical protein